MSAILQSSGPVRNLYKIYANDGTFVRFESVATGSKKDKEYQELDRLAGAEQENRTQAQQRWRSGDLDAFSDMIESGAQWKKGDFRRLKNLYNNNDRIKITLDNVTLTTHAIHYYDLKKILKNGYIENPNAIKEDFKSDKIYEFNFSAISSGSIQVLQLKNKVEGKDVTFNDSDGKWFNYINTTDIDLTRYQIFKETDELDDEHCLWHCLSLYGIDKSLINACKLMCANAFSYPKRKLKEVCEKIKKNIILYFIRNDTGKIEKETYGKNEETISICLYLNHYFIYEETIYTKYSINNYNDVKDKKDWHLISDKFNHKDKRLGKINSLQLVKILYDNNHFIKSDKLKKIDTRDKEIYLDNIAQEQKEYEHKDTNPTEKIVFYLDTETNPTDVRHSILFAGIKHEDEPDVELITENHWYGILNYINKIIRKLRPNRDLKYEVIIYIHNLKYDFNILKEFLNITEMIEKDNSLYRIGCYNNNNYYKCVDPVIKLMDSYKMIAIPLSKFCSTFSLPDDLSKKEAIAYTYYNQQTKNITEEKIEKYMWHFDREPEKKTFMNIITENKEFEYNEDKKTFNPLKYYLYYLKYDVLVLCAGMIELRKKMMVLTGLNINNILTISSLVDKYFKLKGCYDGVYGVKDNLREYIAGSVFGGRVCVNEAFKNKVINDRINDYDCTSLYPSALSRLCREIGIPTGPSTIIPKDNLNFNMINKYIHYIVKIKITKINKKQQIPFIGYKTDGVINYINDVGDGLFFTVDKITLEDYIEHHHIEFEIIDGIYWEGTPNKKMGPVIEEICSNRSQCKKLMKQIKKENGEDDPEYKSNNVMQELLKLMANSVYGKTITKKTTSTKIIKKNGDDLNNYFYKYYNTIKTSTYLNKKQSILNVYKPDDSYNYGLIGSMILSYSKRIMNEVMGVANDNDIPIFYQDTDSMHLLDKDIPKLEDLYFKKYNKILRGDNLGQFHSDFSLKGTKEGAPIIATTSIFLGKKCYLDVLESINEKGEIIKGNHIRLKGITTAGIEHAMKTESAIEIFKKLADGQEYKFILNPKGKVMFQYDAHGVFTRGIFTRTLNDKKNIKK